jgi:type IV pilus assembly protein PilV
MKKANMGVGLVEVLVSLLILSVCLLGLLGLQTKVMQFNQGALYQTRATVLAKDIIDRMRANSQQVDLYVSFFDSAIPSYTNCTSSSANCTTAQLADYDLAEWKNYVARVLPNGKGQITTIGAPANSVYIITLQYDDSRSVGATKFAQDNPIAPKQVSLRTVL